MKLQITTVMKKKIIKAKDLINNKIDIYIQYINES